MKISILTPTLNRGDQLEKIAQSIISVKCSLIWIIGNDGSTDQTCDYVEKISKEYKIKIKYIKSQVRIGKAQMDNILMDIAQSKYLLWCDSGDWFTKNAIDDLVEIADRYIENTTDTDIIGVLGRTKDNYGNNQIEYKFDYKNEEEVFNWSAIERKIIGDGVLLINRGIIGTERFPEVDFVVNESSLWRRLFHNKKIIVRNECYKIMSRDQSDAVSVKSKEMKYLNGMYRAIQLAEFGERYFKASFGEKLNLNIRYFRYSYHLGITFKDAIEEWAVSKKNFGMSTLSYMISFVFYFKDLLTKKIILTHLNMPRKDDIKISITDYN